MPFDPILDKARYDALPEPVKQNYRPATDDEPDFKDHYFIDVTPHPSGYAFENVLGLKNSLGHLKTEKNTLKSKLDKFGDVDPASIPTLQSELESLKSKLEKGNDKEKVAAEVEAKVKEIKAALEQEKEKLATTVTERDKAIASLLIENEAVTALKDLKGNALFLMPHIEKQTRVEWGEDGKPHTVVFDPKSPETARITLKQGSTDPMGVAELVELMSKDQKFKGAFEGSGARGSGASSTFTNPGDGGGDNQQFASMSAQERLKAYHDSQH